MTDDVWSRDEVDSPCVNICQIHPTARICIGCMRTIDEIATWSRLTAEERARIREELPARAPDLKVRRGGRRARRRGDG